MDQNVISITTVEAEARELRRTAEAGPIGKRKSSFELYLLLAGCMKLAERCARGATDMQRMRELVAQMPSRGRNRQYVERRSDEYILVCRYVFSELVSASAERSNASRYAHCLRQAQKLGIGSATLAEHLRDNGGINALFLSRPLVAGTITTRSLRLSSAVTLSKSKASRLVLKRLPDNSFEVLECSTVENDDTLSHGARCAIDSPWTI